MLDRHLDGGKERVSERQAPVCIVFCNLIKNLWHFIDKNNKKTTTTTTTTTLIILKRRKKHDSKWFNNKIEPNRFSPQQHGQGIAYKSYKKENSSNNNNNNSTNSRNKNNKKNNQAQSYISMFMVSIGVCVCVHMCIWIWCPI